jgi:hypothetical protein
MFQFTNPRWKLSLLTLAIFTLTVNCPSANAQGKTLQGGVDMQNYLKPSSGPSLNREFVKQSGDPFSQDPGSSEQFDAPEGSFDSQQPPAPPPPFNLQADDGGSFDGNQQVPQQGGQAPQMGNQQMLPPMQHGQANDPDNSQQMQIQWELWHRRVAEAIFVRFDGLASRAFANSRPIACHAAYTVTRDKQIVNVRLLQKSNNIVFNSMLLMVLKSMNGNPILEFPPGSRRQFVEKTGTFSRNYGVQGFKFTTGDNETIQNQNK